MRENEIDVFKESDIHAALFIIRKSARRLYEADYRTPRIRRQELDLILSATEVIAKRSKEEK